MYNKEKGFIFILPRHIMITIAMVMFASIALIMFSFAAGYRMTAKFAPLVDAVMVVKLENTFAHLWLEELISGDEGESIEKVYAHVDKAMWYATAMLNGGTNEEGTFLPIEEPALHLKIDKIRELTGELRQMMAQRYGDFSLTGVDTKADEEYDRLFNRFIVLADEVEKELQQLISKKLYEFKLLHVILLAIIPLLAALLVAVLYRYEKQRREYLDMIHEAKEQLHHLSHTDSLTNLPNRRAFDDYLQKEWMRAMRERRVLSVFMIDVDFFKQYNDFYGHQKGDECLVLVGATLDALCGRSTDMIARYGGEEFAAVLPYTEHAAIFAEKLRAGIEGLQISHAKSSVADVVTLSIGTSTAVPAQELSAFELLKKADKALYRAKASGRNRIEEG